MATGIEATIRGVRRKFGWPQTFVCPECGAGTPGACECPVTTEPDATRRARGDGEVGDRE